MKPSKYRRAVVRCLRVLASPHREDVDYKSAYERFTYLWEDLDQAKDQGEVSEAQYVAVESVGDCLDDITRHPKRFQLGSDDALRSAPEWDPMREAARAAIEVLEQ